jgi:predicted ATPase
MLAAVARKPEPEVASALDRLIATGLLFRQGVPPHASYLFKHALVQDAAYGTLLREPRRALHARIAETLETQFGEIAENQPELLARHCTEAGLIKKAAMLWGKAGQRSLEHSALVEAIEQLTRGLDQFATLRGTPALRREQIKLQVALITPLIHIRGWAAPETKAAAERAHLLIEQTEALGEPPEDPLLLFSVLYALFAANFVAFNGDAVRGFAEQVVALAEKQESAVPLMIGHRLMGMSLLYSGDFTEGRVHFDRAIAFYNPAAHRRLATQFWQDLRVAILCYRSFALWMLGYPEAALADTEHALKDAREIDHAATLMHTLANATWTHTLCRNNEILKTLTDELVVLSDKKGSLYWKAVGKVLQGQVLLALTGKASDALQTITSALTAYRSTGATGQQTVYLSNLATAYAELGQLDEAWRCICEAMTAVEATKLVRRVRARRFLSAFSSCPFGHVQARLHFDGMVPRRRKAFLTAGNMTATCRTPLMSRGASRKSPGAHLPVGVEAIAKHAISVLPPHLRLRHKPRGSSG